jgi:DNA transposition AAA+ family ATPase
MPLPYPHPLVCKTARLITSNAIGLIVVDDAEQLNESGIAFLRALSAKTSCPLLLVGDEHLLRMRISLIAVLRRFFLL